LKCDDIKERLPWLANSTLPPGERSEVIEHVRDCTACRSEYEATCEWMEELAEHPEPARITAYVYGGLFDGSEAAAIDAHLRNCERCRTEVQLVRESRATMPEAGSRWKPWAIAAALTVIAGASAAGWMWKEREEAILASNRELASEIRALRQPGAGGVLLDLLPESRIERGGAQQPLAIGSGETILVLNSRLPVTREVCAVSLTSAGATVWTAGDARRGEAGEFVVRIPRGFAGPGDYRLALRCGGAEESYRFIVK